MHKPGETIKLPTLASTLKKMVDAERKAGKRNRAKGVVAARDRFYKGDIAETMVKFLKEHGAPFELSDFAEFYAKVEEPTSATYKGYTIYKQGFNSQGPQLLADAEHPRELPICVRWVTTVPTTSTPSSRR